MPEAPRIKHRGDPAAQKIRADTQHEVGILDFVQRNAVPAEGILRRGALHLEIERSRRLRRGVAAACEKIRGGGAARPGRNRGNIQNLFGGGRLQNFRRAVERRVPRGIFENAGAVADFRSAGAVGMIEPLHRRLTESANPSAAHRVERIALDFLDRCNRLAGFRAVDFDDPFRAHDADNGSAAGGALRANARAPFFDTGNNLFLGHEQGDDLVGLLAASAGRRASRGRSDQLEEVSPVHLLFQRFRAPLPRRASCGMPRSPRSPFARGGSRDRFPSYVSPAAAPSPPRPCRRGSRRSESRRGNEAHGGISRAPRG